VVEYAAVRIAVEPLDRSETSLLDTVEQALEVLEGLPREGCGLALDMLDEMLTPAASDSAGDSAGGWGLPKRPVAGDSGYGDAAQLRLGLTERGLPYVLQVYPTAVAHPCDEVPVTPPLSGRGRPPKPRYPDKPATLRALALAAGRSACRKITWQKGSEKEQGQPNRGDARPLPGHPRASGQPAHPTQQRRQPAR
jgi:hypothetical protein